MPVNKPIDSPIDLLHAIASAHPGAEQQSAQHELNLYLSNVPLESGFDLAKKLPGILAQYQFDETEPYTLSPDCLAEVQMALADYRKLPSPAFPSVLLTGKAVQTREQIEKLDSLSAYFKARDELEQSIRPLMDSEREALHGCLSHRLESLLLEEIVPAVLDREKPPANLEAQYDLWQDLLMCERYGVGHLALYFLAIEKDAFRILLPCCFTPEDGARETFQAARTIAALTPQLPMGERAALFAILFLWAEHKAMRAVKHGKPDEDAQAIQELYLMLLTSLKHMDGRFWDNPRFRELYRTFAFNINDKEET